MIKKIWDSKHYLLLTLSVLLAISCILPNFASADYEPGDEKLSRASKSETLKIDDWINNWGKKDEKLALMKKYSKNIEFDNSKRHMMKVENYGTETLYYAYYPLKGENVEKDSNFIVILNESGKIIEDYSLFGVREKSGKVASKVIKNNKLIYNAEINKSGEVESGFVIKDNGEKIDLTKSMSSQGFKQWWNCFNSCLSGQGVASWAIAALATLCGVACASTAGAGCYACLLAADVVTGSVIGVCYGRCKSKF